MTEVVLSDMGFNYPIMLSTYYTACNWAGTAVFFRESSTNRASFDRRQWVLVGLLSVFTSLNTLIGRANIAVPTTFDQVLQAAGPLVVVLICTRIFNRSVSRARKVAVVPIAFGVAMAWYGDMEVSVAATMVSVSCVMLNAAKVVIWSEMLTGEFKVTPLHLLSRVSPMTFAQVGMYAMFRGEPAAIVGQWREILMGWSLHVIAVTGVVSFVMTVLSMHATKFATPLTVSVLGAMKQMFVIGFSIFRMSRPMSRLNLLGLLLVAGGGARYALVSANERKLRKKLGATSDDTFTKKSDDASAKKPAAKKAPSASSSLLPTTVGPSGTMVNGKRPAANKPKGESGGLVAKAVRAVAWGGWWGRGNGDVSRRSR